MRPPGGLATVRAWPTPIPAERRSQHAAHDAGRGVRRTAGTFRAARAVRGRRRRAVAFDDPISFYADSPQREWQWRRGIRAGRARLSPDSWRLYFAVLVDGEPVGMQDLIGTHFTRFGTVSSFSWLAPGRRGQGLGKEMRAAILQLAFAGLGAREAGSDAFVDTKRPTVFPAALAMDRTARTGTPGPGRQIMGQVTPLTACPVQVEDRVHDLPQIAGPGIPGRRPVHPVLLPARDHRLDQRPLLVRQVARIRPSLHAVHPSMHMPYIRPQRRSVPQTSDPEPRETGLNDLSVLGGVPIRVVDAQITMTLSGGGRRTGRYRLITPCWTITAIHRWRSWISITADGRSKPPTGS